MTSLRQTRFVRALLGGADAAANGAGLYRCDYKGRRYSLGADCVDQLVSDGVLSLVRGQCVPTPLARNWLRRQLSTDGEIANQHRHLVPGPNQSTVNLRESPVAGLAVSRNGSVPFLLPHHVQSAERLRNLLERSRMIQRTTMSYDPTRTRGPGGGGRAPFDPGLAGLDARRELALIMDKLPADCAGVLIDVCGFLKGLQTVELERKWPRRSAKLVLRIGLDQLSAHFGLSRLASGKKTNRTRAWIDEGARAEKL